ncbi:MAG: hypothetical protein N2442_08995 [Spirochaetes bacterium]|nr:hypothetical protein [Spirochaetota bacterium]
MKGTGMKAYRIVSLGMAILFALVGGVFLIFPGKVLELFNLLSHRISMEPAPVIGSSFYLILAVSYMYLVTLLAFRMYQYPEDPSFPLFLMHAKLVSAVVSFGFFILRQSYLIFLVNGLVDGAIGLFTLYLYRIVRKKGS